MIYYQLQVLKARSMILEQEFHILRDRIVSHLLVRRHKYSDIASPKVGHLHFTEPHRSTNGRPVRYEFNGWLERSIQRKAVNSLAKR